MSVFSIFKELKLEHSTKFLIIPIIIFGLLFVKSNSTEILSLEEPDATVEEISFCNEELLSNQESSKRLLFVSTLDGGVTALDFTKNGEALWTIPTEPGDLLSSSIHRLEMTSQGKYYRMIPSLNGLIYKFDGDSIEAVPVKAEDLLKSSYKFSDDMVISGGQEVHAYGVNCRTGQIIYEQSMGLKKNKSEKVNDQDSSRTNHDPLMDDVLVVTRHSQTVRANEPRTGNERWNFSIGHHEMQVALSDNCQKTRNLHNDQLNEVILDFELRVIVPEGIICGYSKKNPSQILWSHKFDSPIVSVFRSDIENKLYSVDLFSNARWLWEEHGNDVFLKASGKSELSPALYLGMYNSQLYIQESNMVKKSIDNFKQIEKNLITDEQESKLPKIPFKPIPASNNALIDFVSKFDEDKPNDSTDETDEEKESKDLMTIDEKINAQAVLYASPYADGRGFYFFIENKDNESTQCLDSKESRRNGKGTNHSPQDVDNITYLNSIMYPVRLSLWFYWKEIAVIALTTALIINVMLRNHRNSEREVVFVPIAKEAIEYDEEEEMKQREIEMLRNEAQEKLRSISESGAANEENYVSRFLTDFDLVQCLGKGGFGVVFEVRNKLDDCHYAVKRILLPSKQESRERVLREVKTLANCEHKNIVRYFHAWVEQPPKEWQEAKDKEIFSRDIFSTSITIESPSPTEESKAFSIQTDKSKFTPKKAIINKTTSDNSSWLMNLQKKNFPEFSEINYGNVDTNVDDSCSFIQFKADTDDGAKSKNMNLADESFAIEFLKDSKNVSESENDKSHVISITNETSTSQSSPSNADAKKLHRRNLSLDLASVGNVLPKKLNGVVASTNKMYLYIQMQLCMKTCLKDWLKETHLSDRSAETPAIWNQIVQAVHYVHLKGLIHRDLKPSNIFFALDGQVKIGDFGLVTDMAEIPVDPLTSSNSNSSSSFELDFTIIGHKKHTQRVGTSLYMSPEQAKGLAYNYKVDIYSLGLIFFELLNFFHTETERYKVLQNIKNQKYPEEFVDGFKDEFELLKIMLSNKPEERPTTYGIRARPPLNKHDVDQVSSDWHFELPTRRRDSHRSFNNLSLK